MDSPLSWFILLTLAIVGCLWLLKQFEAERSFFRSDDGEYFNQGRFLKSS